MNLIQKAKLQTIDEIIVRISLDGGLQRANVYSSDPELADDKSRQKFRNYLAVILKETLGEICHGNQIIDTNFYIKKLNELVVNVNFNSGHILHENKIRFGVAQKLLNLYWKFNWLLKGNIPEPIHCPFDSIVIGKLDKSTHDIKWTKMDDPNDYRRLVEAASKAATIRNLSICNWELIIYAESVNYLDKI